MNPMRRVIERRVPEGHDRIAHILVDGAHLLEDDIGHRRQIFVEERRQFDRGEPFGKGRERTDVAEHQRQVALLPAELQVFRMLGQTRHNGGRHIPAERRADLTHLLALLAIKLADARQEDEARREARDHGVEQDAVLGERAPADVSHGMGGGKAQKRRPVDRDERQERRQH